MGRCQEGGGGGADGIWGICEGDGSLFRRRRTGGVGAEGSGVEGRRRGDVISEHRLHPFRESRGSGGGGGGGGGGEAGHDIGGGIGFHERFLPVLIGRAEPFGTCRNANHGVNNGLDVVLPV